MQPDEIAFISSSYTTCSIAIIINMTWIFAIIFYTPSEMKSYKRFLIHAGSNQLVLAFSFMMLMPKPSSSLKEIERPANDSGISYVISGSVVYFIHPARNHMLTCLFVGHFLYNVLDLPVNFFFRYLTVCRPNYVYIFLSKKVMGPLIVFLICVSLTASVLMWRGDMPKEGPAALLSIEVNDWSEYYAHKGDSEETRFGNLIHMDHNVYYMIYIAAGVLTLGYSLLIFSAIQIFTSLAQIRKTVSKRTYDLQRALAVSLTLQSMVPIVFVGVPLCIITVTVSMGFYTPLVNALAMIVFSVHLILPPLISFVYVRPYREIFTKRLKAKVLGIPLSSMYDQSRVLGPRTVHVTTIASHVNSIKRQTF
uniref:G-protein coupled receptors family 1 profile domain-containing protein n=1 Tax=Panagrellus redivivus TaxID=6233 RepID=A0A7E4UVB0_PANRE